MSSTAAKNLSADFFARLRLKASPWQPSPSGSLSSHGSPRRSSVNRYAVCRTKTGGAKRDRTADLLRARQALSQLSYIPTIRLFIMVGLPGLEPGTSRLSVERSSQLSYRPIFFTYLNNLYKPNMNTFFAIFNSFGRVKRITLLFLCLSRNESRQVT